VNRGFLLAVCFAGLPALFAHEPITTQLTWSQEISRIVYRRCAVCHQEGGSAPMALLSYSEVRPWAKAIKERVLTRAMPPWLADPHYGQFKNDRRLAQAEIDTIVAWVNSGAPEGKSQDLPKPPEFVEGWGIGKPDEVITMNKEASLAQAGRHLGDAIDAEADCRTSAHQVLHPARSRAEAHVARGTMRDASPTLCDLADLSVIEMDAVREPDVIAGPAEVLHQLKGPLPKTVQAKSLLVERLCQVCVESDAMTPRQLSRVAHQLRRDREWRGRRDNHAAPVAYTHV